MHTVTILRIRTPSVVVQDLSSPVPVKLPAELAVAINYFGMRFIDTKTRAVIDHFPLLNILASFFLVTICSLGCSQKSEKNDVHCIFALKL